MKVFFIKGIEDYDDEDPILVLADTKKEAEKLARHKNGHFRPGVFENNSPDEIGKAGKGYRLKKGVIWKQFNAG